MKKIAFVLLCSLILSSVFESNCLPGGNEQESDHHDEDEDEKLMDHMTPQCVATLAKHKAELKSMKKVKNPKKAEELVKKLVDGGCQKYLEYVASKNNPPQ